MSGMVKLINNILRNKKIADSTRFKVINAMVLPVTTYVNPIWGFACRTGIDSKYSRIERTTFCALRYVRNDIILRDLRPTDDRKHISRL